MTSLSLQDFDYDLPDELIARHPLPIRSSSRLLCVQAGQIQDKQFSDLPSLLQAGDLLVLNDTKVMKARLFGQKQSGGAVEILVERIVECNIALCHVRANRSLKAGQVIHLKQANVHATMIKRQDNLFVLQFDKPIWQVLENFGELPIPPYFARRADDADEKRYQTVFYHPDKSASVAAPTASLHFDDQLLIALKNQGIQTAFVTLHVGAGTFSPVKTDDIRQHKMHSEYAQLPQITAERINQTRQNGGKIIAVGTTVTRVLETAFRQTASFASPTLSAWSGDTDIFIYPPYRFGVVDRLISNFHLPKSTLLMLVSAFAGTDTIQRAYAHAIDKRYRFFSYGDAMILDKSLP